MKFVYEDFEYLREYIKQIYTQYAWNLMHFVYSGVTIPEKINFNSSWVVAPRNRDPGNLFD